MRARVRKGAPGPAHLYHIYIHLQSRPPLYTHEHRSSCFHSFFLTLKGGPEGGAVYVQDCNIVGTVGHGDTTLWCAFTKSSLGRKNRSASQLSLFLIYGTCLEPEEHLDTRCRARPLYLGMYMWQCRTQRVQQCHRKISYTSVQVTGGVP